MRKILFSLLIAGTGLLSAQTISFEQSEGFFPGDISNQVAEWSATPITGGGFIEGQEIVDNMASDGSQSYLNSYAEQYGPQENYIIGAFYNLETPLPFTGGFTLSYDFYVEDEIASDFQLGLADMEAQAFITAIYVGEDGSVIFIGDDGSGTGQIHPGGGVWVPNAWNNVELEYNGIEMVLKLNGEQVSQGLPFDAGTNVTQIRIVHNNIGGDVYYDNLKINEETASVSDVNAARGTSTVYPNPASDIVNVKLAQDFDVTKTSVYLTNVSGKRVASFNNVEDVNVAKLPAGVYIMTITDGNKTETKKIIKK